MGFFSGIKKAVRSVGKALSTIGNVAKVFSNILKSPLGNILKMVFPPLAMAQGVLSFAGMFGDLAGAIGGGQNY